MHTKDDPLIRRRNLKLSNLPKPVLCTITDDQARREQKQKPNKRGGKQLKQAWLLQCQTLSFYCSFKLKPGAEDSD